MCRPSWPVIPVMSARRTTPTLLVGLRGDPIPVRLELVEEREAPVGLVGLADRGGDPAEPGEGPEEPPVGRVHPPDVARPAPAGPPEPVEAPVVADPIAGVRLDVVVCRVAEASPSVQERGPVGDDRGDRVAPGGRLLAPGGGERGERCLFYK